MNKGYLGQERHPPPSPKSRHFLLKGGGEWEGERAQNINLSAVSIMLIGIVIGAGALFGG